MHKLDTIISDTISYLKEGLNPLLKFHCWQHTQWVYNETVRIGNYIKLDTQKLELLQIAAICHDTGFVQSIHDNEHIGAAFAEKKMHTLGYDSYEIEQVKLWILETNTRLKPSCLGSKVLRDADSGYIGTSKFKSWSENLFKEFVSQKQINGNRKEWYQLQLAFFNKHQFYSSFSKLYRQPLKAKNLDLIKQELSID